MRNAAGGSISGRHEEGAMDEISMERLAHCVMRELIPNANDTNDSDRDA